MRTATGRATHAKTQRTSKATTLTATSTTTVSTMAITTINQLLAAGILFCLLLPPSNGFSSNAPYAPSRSPHACRHASFPSHKGLPSTQSSFPPSSISRNKLFASSPSSGSDNSHRNFRPFRPLRTKLRQLTGLSLTALRATLRATTGFSLTALRNTIRTFTGISLSRVISSAMQSILGVLHPGVRYFLQPLLILYYAPLLMMRYAVGPTRGYVEEGRGRHEELVEGWRRAVEAAERANEGGYWPVHLNEDGTISASLPPDPSNVLDVTDGIEQSVAATLSSSTSS